MLRAIERCLGSLRHHGNVVIMLGLLLVPTVASAEAINLTRNVRMDPGTPAATRNADRPLLGLNENGDVTIQYRNVSVTMSYNAADLLPPTRERVALNPAPDPSALGGFGIKVGFAF